MRRATFVRLVRPTPGRAELFRLDPPPIDCRGAPCPYVVASAVDVMGLPEVYLFASDERGKILHWDELSGSRRGTLDIDAVLRDLGYEVVRWSDP